MTIKEFSYINPLYLIGLFLICPLLVVTSLVDIVFLDGLIKKILPAKPEDWAFWLVIFNLPHIISSFLTLADKSNVSKYGSRVLKATLLLIFLSILFNGIIPLNLSGSDLYNFQLIFFACYGFATIYHVLTQQLGVGLILSGVAPDSTYRYFKWFSIWLSYILFLLVISGDQIFDDRSYFVEYIYYFCTVLLIACLYLSGKIASASKTKVGLIYICSNMFMIMSVFIFATLEYTIFALIVPRFIHDLTAFILYANHDSNKFANNNGNYIYRIFNGRLPIVIISPVIGMVVAAAINSSVAWFLLYSIFIFDFLHYYIESFIWKGGGSHRDFLRIKQC